MPPRLFMLGILLVLGVVIAWQLGDHRGYERGLMDGTVHADSMAAASSDADAPGVADGGADRDELDTMRRDRDLAQATIIALRDELTGLDALSAADRAELDLYRRIGRDDAPTGLGIDAVAGLQGEPPALRVTLVQTRGRSRAGGRLLLSIPPGDDSSAGGVDKANPNLDKGAAALFEDGRPAWEAPFDLRFFQTVDVVLAGWKGNWPTLMRVDVIPTIGRHKPFREFVDRAALRILD